eukprot:TRINITY_DN5144_c0_g1_i1.p1 TRINITY_DN5144_c0_g1~~TRINITY_DN5144_c0_g1_i1.p1  ORF type:complete len:500 (+),score=112.80 TRINITY_DN5144_c0_g1_i1:178-1677(+)
MKLKGSSLFSFQFLAVVLALGSFFAVSLASETPTHASLNGQDSSSKFAATSNAPQLWVGVSKINGTLPIGAPLAGYNYPPRRTEVWPLPKFTQYTTWMTPSVGMYDPTWVKCVVISNGIEKVAFVTMDVIGSDGSMGQLGYDIAASQGFGVQRDNVLFSASHSHSGPGAIGPEFLWSVAPATDLMVRDLQQSFANSIATALLEAENNMQPAVMDIGMSELIGVTHNRRAGISKYVQYGTIDPHLGVIAIDTPAGEPIATLWNFAIHGICYDAPNLNFSGDVMGSANNWIEENIGGVSMFINGDAGDINPIFSVACNGGPVFSGGAVIGSAVQKLRSGLKPTNNVQIQAASSVIDFGMANLNLTLQRVDNCTKGGELDICTICSFLDCTAPIRLNEAWLETIPRFTAFSFWLNAKSTVVVSIPGEALVELGWQIRNDTLDLGFDQTLLAGYSNNHMGYFATTNEYDIGGYESLLTFWGAETANQVRAGCKVVAEAVAFSP